MKNHPLKTNTQEIILQLLHFWEQGFDGKLLVLEICAMAKGSPTKIKRATMIELEEQGLAPPYHPTARDFLCAIGAKSSEEMTNLFSSPGDREIFIDEFRKSRSTEPSP